jgi:mono/diheme cytochrome c family protein
MKRFIVVAIATLLGLASAGIATQRPASTTTSRKAFVDQYCVTCHNVDDKVAGITFDTMDLARVPRDGEIWERAIKKLKGGMMPPPGAKQPDHAAALGFATWLETTLDAAAAATPNPGSVALHRLNRAEYAASIKELFAIDVDSAALLPPDDTSNGFDNIANVLKVSPSFLDQYINASRSVTLQAIGQPPVMTPVRLVPHPGSDSNLYGKGGLPLGTQGTITEYLFPSDGEYQFQGGNIVFLDGVRVIANARTMVKAGYHNVAVATTPQSPVESELVLQSFVPGNGGGFAAGAGAGGGGGRGGRGGGGGGLQITGPYNPTGPWLDTSSRQRIFVCHPANEAEEIPCATKIFSEVARRAFRRPITDADLSAPLAFFKKGKANDGKFETGIQTGLMTIISSPKFLYRAEVAPKGLANGATYKVPELDVASRLSFFLWSSIPDDSLQTLAVQGKLKDPLVLEAQVRRLLSDNRAKALVNNFAFQWLRVREIDSAMPDAVLYPNFDGNLKTAMRREVEMFIDSIFDEDRSVLDLLTADYTYLNERLAAHYGVPDVRGNQMRRVTLTDSRRFGILGKGGLLVITSYPNRTSSVLRGSWILDNILGTPPAAPPPNVEGFKENKEGEKARTVRQIMEQHRANPSCNGCHGVMDPLGFSLEGFDAVGAWRTKDRFAGTPIDSSDKLIDGTPVNGPDDLRKALASHPDQFVQTLTEKLMTYALGRNMEYYDMPAIRKIVRDAAKDNYRFSSIVMGIVKSTPFQMSKVE